MRVWRAVPVAGSQIRTSPSSPAEASQDPSGATANAGTPPVWPVRVWRAVPVAGSQIRTSPPSSAEASQDPSGATTNARTSLVWPVSTRDSAGWGRSGSAVMARRCGVVSPATNCSAIALVGPSPGSRVAKVAASDPGGSSGPRT